MFLETSNSSKSTPLLYDLLWSFFVSGFHILLVSAFYWYLKKSNISHYLISPKCWCDSVSQTNFVFAKWLLFIFGFLSLSLCPLWHLDVRVSNEPVMLALSILASVLASHWHHFLYWEFFYSQRKRNSKITPKPKGCHYVIMSWLINTRSDILISVRSEQKQGRGMETSLATDSLPELIRKTFYHGIWSNVLKAAANVCL